MPKIPTSAKRHEKRIQAAQMVKSMATGLTFDEAGQELGMGRAASATLASSDEVRYLVKRFEDQMLELTARRVSSALDEAYSTIEDIMRNGSNESTRLKAAERIIELSWRLSDKVSGTDEPVGQIPTEELLESFLEQVAKTLGAETILRFAAELKAGDKLAK